MRRYIILTDEVEIELGQDVVEKMDWHFKGDEVIVFAHYPIEQNLC